MNTTSVMPFNDGIRATNTAASAEFETANSGGAPGGNDRTRSATLFHDRSGRETRLDHGGGAPTTTSGGRGMIWSPPRGPSAMPRMVIGHPPSVRGGIGRDEGRRGMCPPPFIVFVVSDAKACVTSCRPCHPCRPYLQLQRRPQLLGQLFRACRRPTLRSSTASPQRTRRSAAPNGSPWPGRSRRP